MGDARDAQPPVSLKREARDLAVWKDTAPIEALPAGRSLVIEDHRPFVLHFGLNEWQRVFDRVSAPFGSVHRVRLRREDLRGHSLHFTRFYPNDERWEGVDHMIRIGNSEAEVNR